MPNRLIPPLPSTGPAKRPNLSATLAQMQPTAERDLPAFAGLLGQALQERQGASEMGPGVSHVVDAAAVIAAEALMATGGGWDRQAAPVDQIGTAVHGATGEVSDHPAQHARVDLRVDAAHMTVTASLAASGPFATAGLVLAQTDRATVLSLNTGFGRDAGLGGSTGHAHGGGMPGTTALDGLAIGAQLDGLERRPQLHELAPGVQRGLEHARSGLAAHAQAADETGTRARPQPTGLTRADTAALLATATAPGRPTQSADDRGPAAHSPTPQPIVSLLQRTALTSAAGTLAPGEDAQSSSSVMRTLTAATYSDQMIRPAHLAPPPMSRTVAPAKADGWPLGQEATAPGSDPSDLAPARPARAVPRGVETARTVQTDLTRPATGVMIDPRQDALSVRLSVADEPAGAVTRGGETARTVQTDLTRPATGVTSDPRQNARSERLSVTDEPARAVPRSAEPAAEPTPALAQLSTNRLAARDLTHALAMTRPATRLESRPSESGRTHEPAGQSGPLAGPTRAVAEDTPTDADMDVGVGSGTNSAHQRGSSPSGVDPAAYESAKTRLETLLRAMTGGGQERASLEPSGERSAPDAVTASAAETEALAVSRSGAQPSTGVPAPGLARPAGAMAPPSLPLEVPAGHPAWASEVGNRLRWLLGHGESKAELVLTPPSLGRLEIKLQLSGDHTRVQLLATTQAAREALEQALPRLREVLEQSGIQLGQADVGTSHDPPGGSNGNPPELDHDALDEARIVQQAAASPTPPRRGLVDIFA